jgi:ATP-dependent helicase/nuclease subunit A
LEFVDAAIAALPDPGMGEHQRRRAHASEVPGPGTVTLWPAVTPGGARQMRRSGSTDATRELARGSRGDPGLDRQADAGEQGTHAGPEDVMILVKRRGELASLIVARLYAEGVPVAGVDRLRLNAPLAVQDLLAAIRFVLQPGDDLSLASLLVSPLIGWSAGRADGGGGPRTWRAYGAHLRDTQRGSAWRRC